MDLNKVMIIGRLTRDPESRTIPSGQTVANFSVATSRQWTNQTTGEKRTQTEYHNVVAWRKLAEICAKYAQKGRQVYVEGYLQTRSWDDPSGNKHYRTEIIADNIILLSRPGGGAGDFSKNNNEVGSGEPTAASAGASAEETITVEDIPF